MAFKLTNVIKNNILCYISTSRDSASVNDIVNSTVAFYKDEQIKTAKDLVYKLIKKNAPVRRSCATHPNPLTADVEDILDVFAGCESKGISLPEFLADRFDAFPPAQLSQIASVINDMREEMARFRDEMAVMRAEKQADIRALEDANCVKNDVSDIKSMLIQKGTSVRPDECSAVPSAPPFSERSFAEVVRDLPGVDGVCEKGDGWSLVQNSRNPRKKLNPSAPPFEIFKKRRSVVRSRPQNKIFGTKVLEGGLSGAQRELDVFVGRCQIGTTGDEILQYCSENGVEPVKCENVNTVSRNHCSFKVTVSANDRNKLLNADFWPVGAMVKKFMNFNKKDSKRKSLSSDVQND